MDIQNETIIKHIRLSHSGALYNSKLYVKDLVQIACLKFRK